MLKIYSIFCFLIFIYQCNAYNIYNQPSEKIIGGCDAKPGEFPWMGILEFTQENGTEKICGITLLSTNFGLTSAKCANAAKDAFNNTIKFGMVDRNDATASKTSIATVSTTAFVDNDTLIINDIALIQFLIPVKLTETIKPINLPIEDIGLIERTNIIVGWGQYSINCGGNNTNFTISSNTSQILLKASVPVMDYTECKQVINSNSNWNKIESLTNNTICAGTKVYGGASGDLGSPLFSADDKGVWYQVGILSAVLTQVNNQTNFVPPRVYTRVSAYCDFIKSATGEKLQCGQATATTTITTKSTLKPTSSIAIGTQKISILLFLTVFIKFII